MGTHAHRKIGRLQLFAVGMLLLGAICVARGDVVTMKDGTVIEGVVIERPDGYWVRSSDGTSRVIPKRDVVSVKKAPTSAPSAAGKTPGATGGAGFSSVKSQADRVESPILAVTMWEKFIDSKPNAADLASAQTELAKWKDLDKGKAEKINGKWIGGDERKELIKRADGIIKEAAALEDGNFLEAIKKYEEGLKIYPNHFEGNFRLGFFYLVKATSRTADSLRFYDGAIKALETAVKVDPSSPEALSDLAIAYNFRDRYQDAVLTAYKAVQIQDTKELVQNLIGTIAHAPPGMRTSNAKVSPIMDEAVLLARKQGIDKPSGFVYLPPGFSNAKRESEGKRAVEGDPTQGPPGLAWTGSGFFISDDGYFLTNRHVATGKPDGQILTTMSFRVRTEDGTEKNADLIAIDDKFDIALMKVQLDEKTPFLKISDHNPNPAAQVLVLGYPATGEENEVMQVAPGTVKSINPGDDHEVWFDLSTTHGNSGGPIVDKDGHVIGILTGGRKVYDITYVLGVGPLQMKKFLEKSTGKMPAVTFAAAESTSFDGEKLAAECRKSTLLVMAIRGSASGATTQPSNRQ
jgi:S1-C subfamily serine protease